VNWPAFFLGCFLVGFLLSAASFALSAIDLHLHVHIPFIHHLHLPHAHAVHGVHTPHGGTGVTPINFATLMAFLAWFGGTGYLLTSELRWLALPAVAVATFAGLVGATAVFWVMARVLWSPHENMRAVDYQMVGVLGRVGTPIRPGGTGELIYTHGGTRHSCGARAGDGQAIERGAEVVVTSYNRGIAYVQRWEEFAQEQEASR